MWKPRRLTTLWASTACFRDNFTLCRVLSRWRPSFTQLFKRLSVFEPWHIAQNYCTADQIGPLSLGAVLLLPPQHWDCGFESKSVREQMFFFCCVALCVGSGPATGWVLRSTILLCCTVCRQRSCDGLSPTKYASVVLHCVQAAVLRRADLWVLRTVSVLNWTRQRAAEEEQINRSIIVTGINNGV
jgi:hypothetical protein